MRIDSIKEILNNHRCNKTLLWQTLIVLLGGTIGLLLKAVNAGTNFFEIMLIVIGFTSSILCIVAIVNISEDISKIIKKINEVKKDE